MYCIVVFVTLVQYKIYINWLKTIGSSRLLLNRQSLAFYSRLNRKSSNFTVAKSPFYIFYEYGFNFLLLDKQNIRILTQIGFEKRGWILRKRNIT